MFEFLHPEAYRARYPRWLVGKPLLVFSSALCSLGDALFGYSQGCISTALVQPSFIRRMYGVKDITLDRIAHGDNGFNEYVFSLTVACLNITAFFSALAAARVCDTMGRRASMRLGSLLCLVSTLFQVFAPNLGIFVAGRCIQGLGVGFLSMTVPIIQAEIAPGHARGVFIVVENFFLNTGYCLSTWVGYAFYFYMPSEISWRGSYIVFSGLAAVLFTGTIFLPETPRWLIKNGFYEEGLATLVDLQGDGTTADENITTTYQEIVAAIEFEASIGKPPGWWEIFTQYTRRTVMGVTSQMFAQLNGINAILYFLPENLLRAGFDVPKSLLYSGACSTMLVAGIIPTLFLVDSWGRRPILLIGGVGMALCLSAVGGLQYFVDSLGDMSPELASAAKGIFACVCIYLAFFAFSWGPIPWLIPAEVFPLRARARGMALATGSNWLWNFAVAFATPLFRALRGGTYFIIVGFVLFSTCLVLFVYRETAHKTLEELAEVFGEVPFVDASTVMVPDPTEARLSMHHGMGARSMSMNPSARERSMSMARSGTALSRVRTNAPSIRPRVETEDGRLNVPGIGLHTTDEKGASSALTSRTTVAVDQEERKSDM